jgi:hypothetical protein
MSSKHGDANGNEFSNQSDDKSFSREPPLKKRGDTGGSERNQAVPPDGFPKVL